MGGGYKGVRDYGIVIELLRGNLVEPVTPPTHHVSLLNVLYIFFCCYTYICSLLIPTVLYCTQESSVVRRDEGAIKEVVGRQRFMRPREIIEMIESGNPPMDKVPPDNQTSPTPDFGL